MVADRQTRASLHAFGVPVVEAARELGGILSFGPRARNKPLSGTFKALGRSMCPLWQKLQVLSSRLWAKALYGVAGCPVAATHIQ